MATYVAVATFVVVYLLIALEKAERTKAALVGAGVLLVGGILTLDDAFVGGVHHPAVDWNTIFLLIGMMVLVHITGGTGVFAWLAIKAAHLAKGKPLRLLIFLSLLTAVLSAFLDNVTTVLLITPVALSLTGTLRISPLPFLICIIVSSNIGGTATLIGDPPNIIIGSHAGLGFVPFVVHLAPLAVLNMVVMVATAAFLFRSQLRAAPEDEREAATADASWVIQDRPLLVKSLAVLGLTMLGFVLHERLGYEPATVAFIGAALLMILAPQRAATTLASIEWSTLFFFIGLFVIVGGLVKTGVVAAMAHGLLTATKGSIPVLAVTLVWGSGVISGIVDNIPYVATMAPLLSELTSEMFPGVAASQIPHLPQVQPLWWSLALGACLGGNATIIGAAANVVVSGIAAEHEIPLSFRVYLKYGLLFAAESLILSTVYIWLRYL